MSCSLISPLICSRVGRAEHVTRQLLDIDLEPAGDLKALGGNQSLLDGEEVTELSPTATTSPALTR